MDVTAVRWVSLGVIVSLAALASWALADSARREEPDGARDDTSQRALMIEVRRPGRPPERVRIEGAAVLGRGRECHIVFHDSTVSKEHARLRLEGRTALVEDLHSTNGTLVNGRAIDGPTPLRRGDRIGLGPNVIVFAGEV